MTRKYNWTQFSPTCGELSVEIYDNDKAFVGYVRVCFVSGLVSNCSFVGFVPRTCFVGQEIQNAIHKGFLAFSKDGDSDRLLRLFDSEKTF